MKKPCLPHAFRACTCFSGVITAMPLQPTVMRPCQISALHFPSYVSLLVTSLSAMITGYHCLCCTTLPFCRCLCGPHPGPFSPEPHRGSRLAAAARQQAGGWDHPRQRRPGACLACAGRAAPAAGRGAVQDGRVCGRGQACQVCVQQVGGGRRVMCLRSRQVLGGSPVRIRQPLRREDVPRQSVG